MKQIKSLCLSFALALGVGMFASVPAFAATDCAATPAAPACQIKGGSDDATGDSTDSLDVKLNDIVNLLLYLIGAIAVIVIVISGVKYVVSDGDSAKIKSAKDTILYAVIGLVIAILAFGIVNFVITKL